MHGQRRWWCVAFYEPTLLSPEKKNKSLSFCWVNVFSNIYPSGKMERRKSLLMMVWGECIMHPRDSSRFSCLCVACGSLMTGARVLLEFLHILIKSSIAIAKRIVSRLIHGLCAPSCIMATCLVCMAQNGVRSRPSLRNSGGDIFFSCVWRIDEHFLLKPKIFVAFSRFIHPTFSFIIKKVFRQSATEKRCRVPSLFFCVFYG